MTRKAFVTGYPIAHSRSPLIHGYWLREHGIDGTYERIPVRPEDFAAFVHGLRDRGFCGGNVTIPHKEAAFSLVERRTDRAARLGAVNTLWFDGPILCGDNTDVTGFVANLDAALGEDWERRHPRALVIGAGGAARAVVAGLLDRGYARVRVVNRTRTRLADLIAFDPSRVSGHGFDEAPLLLADTQLLVNTTSLGMAGQPSLELDLATLPAGAAVSDIVYTPLETPLLAAARARGLIAVDGLGMLLHQAVPGFERWFGVRPRVSAELRALVEADLLNIGPLSSGGSAEGSSR